MKRVILVLLAMLAIGVAGYWIGQRQADAPVALEQIASTPAKKAYVCPMHAHIVQAHPGACPICGMDLVAADETSGESTAQIHVDTTTQARLGVRLASAERAALTHDIATFATLVADESAVLRITPNIDGVLTRLHVNRVGQRIARGQVFYEISSQDALNLQYEYIDIQRRGAPTHRLAEERRAQYRKMREDAAQQDEAAREQAERMIRQGEEQLFSILQPLQRDLDRVTLRLKQIGFTEEMVQQLARSARAFPTIPARADRACVVKEVMARPGMQIGHMTEVLSCVDTTRAWLEVVLYPDQLEWVREGDAVTVVFDDGASIKTRLTGITPIVEGTARTVRARLAINPGRAPVIGEYATVTIHAAPRNVLSAPKSAVIRTGRGNIVMRAMGKGHFMPVNVTTGIEGAERIAILDGLKEGDQVAVNGQFLLDAAASIAESAQRMQGK